MLDSSAGGSVGEACPGLVHRCEVVASRRTARDEDAASRTRVLSFLERRRRLLPQRGPRPARSRARARARIAPSPGLRQQIRVRGPESASLRDPAASRLRADVPGSESGVWSRSGVCLAWSGGGRRLHRLTHMLQRQYILRRAHIRIERRSSISVRPSRDPGSARRHPRPRYPHFSHLNPGQVPTTGRRRRAPGDAGKHKTMVPLHYPPTPRSATASPALSTYSHAPAVVRSPSRSFIACNLRYSAGSTRTHTSFRFAAAAS